MTIADLQSAQIVGRAVEVTFSITYRDGSTANLPVTVKALEMYESGILVQSFFASRGEIEQVGPSTYRAYIDPSLYTLQAWLVARWIVVHPSSGAVGSMDVDVFFSDVAPAPATSGLYRAETVSDVKSIGEDRHLIASEITRRFALLLRRFNGTYVAFFLHPRSGVRCSACWDYEFQAVTDSQCRVCYRTGFRGGYSRPIFGWVFHNRPATQVARSFLGDTKIESTTDWWTLPFPELTPGDFFVKPDGTRWRIDGVPTNKMEGEDASQITRQLGQVELVHPDDVIMQVPAPDLRRPPDIFVGFLRGVTKIDEASGIVFEASGTL